MTVEEFRSLCVDRFPDSPNRHSLFGEIERLLLYLHSILFPCELWINGSYLCEKNEPEDVDIAVAFWVIDADVLDLAVFSYITNTFNGGKNFSSSLDTYLCPRFDRSDPRRGADLTSYWAETWGIGRDGWLKGFAVIAVGETDAQHRLIA